MIKYLLGLLAFVSSATAGDFIITNENSTSIEVTYYGDVYRHDHLKWKQLESLFDCKVVILTIETYGGDAFGGIDLYWTVSDTPNVMTVAGSQVGAWSAGAMLWLAGDYRTIAEGGKVGWHRAYCYWDPEPQPDIGCDVHIVDVLSAQCLYHAGYNGEHFMLHLKGIQEAYGTDGWIELNSLGWFVTDHSNPWVITKVDPQWLGINPMDWKAIHANR